MLNYVLRIQLLKFYNLQHQLQKEANQFKAVSQLSLSLYLRSNSWRDYAIAYFVSNVPGADTECYNWIHSAKPQPLAPP